LRAQGTDPEERPSPVHPLTQAAGARPVIKTMKAPAPEPIIGHEPRETVGIKAPAVTSHSAPGPAAGVDCWTDCLCVLAVLVIGAIGWLLLRTGSDRLRRQWLNRGREETKSNAVPSGQSFTENASGRG